jgi:putative ABC transport system substrate-binding protein
LHRPEVVFHLFHNPPADLIRQMHFDRTQRSRREGLGVLLALCAGSTVEAWAQTLAPPRRVAYLASVSLEADKVRFEEFRRSLQSLGYTEGRNLTIDLRREANPAQLAQLVDELLRLQPDVLVTVATPATAAAKNATRRIPIVFSGVGDPVAFGLVDSLRRPGGNLTGVANIVSDLAGKRLELLKELLPELGLVGIPLETQTPVSVLQWEASERAAHRMGLRLFPMRITSAESYDAAFNAAAAAGVAAVAVSLSPGAGANSARIVRLAAQYRLPSIYARSLFVEDGGLMSYGASFETDGRVMARLVQRIFAGASPAELPIEEPTEFELIINMRTARQLGLAVPRSLLLRADRVIE